jgi:hypothetical protein
MFGARFSAFDPKRTSLIQDPAIPVLQSRSNNRRNQLPPKVWSHDTTSSDKLYDDVAWDAGSADATGCGLA